MNEIESKKKIKNEKANKNKIKKLKWIDILKVIKMKNWTKVAINLVFFWKLDLPGTVPIYPKHRSRVAPFLFIIRLFPLCVLITTVLTSSRSWWHFLTNSGTWWEKFDLYNIYWNSEWVRFNTYNSSRTYIQNVNNNTKEK